MVQHVTDTSFSVFSPTECWSFLCLNYFTFGTVSCRATGGHGELGAQLRRLDSGWWQKPREDAAEKRLPAIMPGMTEAVVEGARDPWGKSRRKKRASFREKSPQAHMVELKHPYAVLKEKILSVSTLSVTCSFRFGDAMYCLVPFILHTNQNPWRNADSVKRKNDKDVLETVRC